MVEQDDGTPMPEFKCKADVLSYILTQLEKMSADYRMAAHLLDIMGHLKMDLDQIEKEAVRDGKRSAVSIMRNPLQQVRYIDATRTLLSEMVADMRAQRAIEMTKGIK